ncbi:deoxyribodipyrimidine photo-lyase [Asticcacaulis sp. EMRT-3]|uniref:cryptochrome/photolyase family protein n=1 Tax=Asticcacaulis sp. EMRT-3 TaxID=3040349 RepID=UPI0024AFE074|nr:deoxyribodipyrimidine photo-lyase [Asticcacaulis sp. EMRT-3]MDI7774480.1 deoxyribodipyrimidine photo-lyase [Asticcacaulis sp. EMRT-3]
MPAPVILWFRRDLRLQDNSAVASALALRVPILPVYIHDDDLETRSGGAASRWWLDKSLHVLDEELRGLSSRLIVLEGSATILLPYLCQTYSVKSVICSHTFDPRSEENDLRIIDELAAIKVCMERHNSTLLTLPCALKTQGGTPFRVFTPFFKALQAQGHDRIAMMPPALSDHWPLPDIWPDSLTIDDLGLRPRLPPSGRDWSAGFARFTPGERGARKALRHFLRHDLPGYAGHRDRPDLDVTSHLSPHLRFGEISPRRILFELDKHVAAQPDLAADAAKFRAELAWRDFSYNLLHQQPRLHDVNFREDFNDFPWRDNDPAFRAWCRGETGYDLVDAGMKELWRTGYMHNRVRMIAASFLVKHLLIDWRRGEQWFWDCLLDADPANNPASWQWVAGCGADAAPYFRVFNPISQAAKFDPHGHYRARYLDGDETQSDKYVKADKAGVPNANPKRSPVIEHAFARQRALDAYQNRGDEG